MPSLGEYGPSTVPWVRDEVDHLERTGTGLRGRSVVLLTTVGARSGLLRKTPLMRVAHAGTYAAVASARGGDRHPSWYANALAHPAVVLRDGDADLDLVAREVTGAERSRWWSLACTVFPSYVDYQRRTRRRIPLLVLEPPVLGRGDMSTQSTNRTPSFGSDCADAHPGHGSVASRIAAR